MLAPFEAGWHAEANPECVQATPTAGDAAL